MMATGYVHPVADGKVTTLRDFALMCARGMGACIMMRDDPADAPIPERFAPSTWNEERLAEAHAAMAEILALTEAEAEERAAADFTSKMADHVAYVSKEAASMRRCKEMLACVEAWETGAKGIKSFMLEQLRTSIGDGREYRPDAPERKTAVQWRADALAKASRDIAYHEIERNKEIDRTNGRNEWLAALRASLPEADAATPADAAPGIGPLADETQKPDPLHKDGEEG